MTSAVDCDGCESDVLVLYDIATHLAVSSVENLPPATKRNNFDVGPVGGIEWWFSKANGESLRIELVKLTVDLVDGLCKSKNNGCQQHVGCKSTVSWTLRVKASTAAALPPIIEDSGGSATGPSDIQVHKLARPPVSATYVLTEPMKGTDCGGDTIEQRNALPRFHLGVDGWTPTKVPKPRVVNAEVGFFIATFCSACGEVIEAI